MIDYRDEYFGIHLLFRIQGSAAYKAASFALASNGVYLLLYYFADSFGQVDGLKQFDLITHPYVVAIHITAFMFVLSSKVTFAYNRYWEACTALHNMHAKWIDVGSTLAAFHMQSKAYDAIRPPAYGDHQDQRMNVDELFIQRGGVEDGLIIRQGAKSSDELDQSEEVRKFISEDGGKADRCAPQSPKRSILGGFLARRNKRNSRGEATSAKARNSLSIQTALPTQPLPFPDYSNRSYCKNAPSSRVTWPMPMAKDSTRMTLSAAQQLPGGKQLKADPSGYWTVASESTKLPRAMSSDGIATPPPHCFRSIGEDRNSPVPSLLLQEAAHLLSLLSAVALSTLRCDAEGAEAPLVAFQPGRPWPAYNSDDDPDMQRYGYEKKRVLGAVRYLADASRTAGERAAYNAARPVPVIGGVSEGESRLLRRARGGFAKTALAYMWLQEFMIRERQRGSFGDVAPPIFSRLPQYLSDGHLWYNGARKMSYVPFPFPHAQMACLFELICVFVVPTLMLSKTEAIFGFVMNFFTVLLFQGLNELSKELEYPFRGMPNDLPLNLFQAHFNEAVVTMFAGYHPDAWWEMRGDC